MGYIEDVTRDLYNYLPPLTKKDDFDFFWDTTLKQAKDVPLQPARHEVHYPSKYVRVYDISFNGMDKTRIHGWLIVPAFLNRESFPCLIHYHGFTGNRGEASDFMHWITLGMAVLSVDIRDQGGATGSSYAYSHGYVKNVVSKGIHNKWEYYFRYVYMDCLRAIDYACEQKEINPAQIVIEGGSQGGGIGMAVVALDNRPKLAMVDVPSNSNLVSRVEGNHGAFGAITEYLNMHPDQTDFVFDNLSYFDTMNFADRISCPVLASVALKDETCPAQMYFATFNRILCEKEIVIYPFNGHEGGKAKQTEIKLKYVMKQCKEWF